MSDVTAVIVAARSGRPRPTGVADVVEAPSLAAITDIARAARTPLVWVLDAGAEPQDGALDALLAYADTPAVSLVVAADGTPDTARLGRFAEADADEIIGAAQARCVPLRHVPVTSLLVARELVAELAPPDAARLGPYAGTEWTARLFARRRGLLVPASRVRAAPLDGRAPAHALRMARTGVWRRGETVRELGRALLG